MFRALDCDDGLLPSSQSRALVLEPQDVEKYAARNETTCLFLRRGVTARFCASVLSTALDEFDWLLFSSVGVPVVDASGYDNPLRVWHMAAGQEISGLRNVCYPSPVPISRDCLGLQSIYRADGSIIYSSDGNLFSIKGN